MAVKDTLLTLMEPAVAALGYRLVDVDYLKEGPRWFVRVFIHSENGVSLDDCQRVSTVVGDLLETQDVVKHAFNLEVSSPGAERVLKTPREYDVFAGHLVHVTLKQPLESGERQLVGRLGALLDGNLQLHDLAGKERDVPMSMVKQVRLALRGHAPALSEKGIQ